MSDFLTVLAKAHEKHEGYYPPGAVKAYPKGSLAWRNKNPGNLRLHRAQAAFGAKPGQGGFAAFPTYEQGFAALQADLAAKILGKSAHIDYLGDPTFLDLIEVYAPAADRNNPFNYARAVCADLQAAGYRVRIDTPLLELATFIQPPFEPPADTARRLKRLIAKAISPERRARLQKRYDDFISSQPTP